MIESPDLTRADRLRRPRVGQGLVRFSPQRGRVLSMTVNRIGKLYKWSEAPHGEATIRVIGKKRTRWIYVVLSKSGPGVVHR